MDFRIIKKEAILLNPLENMARKNVACEIRVNPLTGRTSRVCHFMTMTWPRPDLAKLAAGTEAMCPFCPDKVMLVTPCFPEELVPEKRLVAGDVVLFPNLAPYDAISAVATLGGRHFLPIGEIEPELIAQAYGLALNFFRRLDQAGHPESVYHLINWNYMPASGSSLIHPHLQVFATSTAPNLMREELAASRKYRDDHGVVFWDELVKAEQEDGRRFIGRIGRTVWLSSFAPLGVAGDVLVVVEGVRRTLDLTDQDLRDLALGLTRTMRAYEPLGLNSFNVNFFTGDRGDDHFRFHLVFSPRTYFNLALGTPDVGALRNLYNEAICMTYPERTAEIVRAAF
ncbi:MAG: hypothetical protein AB1641_26145 [Thermodesulfobacteriota bacterium]